MERGGRKKLQTEYEKSAVEINMCITLIVMMIHGHIPMSKCKLQTLNVSSLWCIKHISLKLLETYMYT
jgi:hypothetical protein